MSLLTVPPCIYSKPGPDGLLAKPPSLHLLLRGHFPFEFPDLSWSSGVCAHSHHPQQHCCSLTATCPAHLATETEERASTDQEFTRASKIISAAL